MRIDIDWSNDGNGRSWRRVFNEAGIELDRIECGNGGYRYVVDGATGAWHDRVWEAIAGLKKEVANASATSMAGNSCSRCGCTAVCLRCSRCGFAVAQTGSDPAIWPIAR